MIVGATMGRGGPTALWPAGAAARAGLRHDGRRPARRLRHHARRREQPPAATAIVTPHAFALHGESQMTYTWGHANDTTARTGQGTSTSSRGPWRRRPAPRGRPARTPPARRARRRSPRAQHAGDSHRGQPRSCHLAQRVGWASLFAAWTWHALGTETCAICAAQCVALATGARASDASTQQPTQSRACAGGRVVIVALPCYGYL